MNMIVFIVIGAFSFKENYSSQPIQNLNLYD